MKVLTIFLFPILMFGQTVNEKSGFIDKMDSAYTNAMKGVYFALENIPEKKNSVSKDLITNDELIANVKIRKEVNGISVIATGFYNSYKITAEVYRDYKALKDEGFIDYIPRQ